MNASSSAQATPRRVPLSFQALALLAGPGALLTFDLLQWLGLPAAERTWQTLLFVTDSGVYLVWFAFLPFCLLIRRPTASLEPAESSNGSGATGGAICFAICTAAGFLLAAGYGWRVKDLPPLYHDEYSYLFQASTFLSGRLSFPAPEPVGAFRQMHVLDDGVFASRYFPGTGMWLAPFLAFGKPIVGWWVINGLVAGFTALAGRRFSVLTGYLAGLLVATAPGMIAFGNLLLSPSPTMLGMAVFLWAYFAIFEDRGFGWPVVAGLAIGFAFLTRPLTAAGLGIAYACHALFRLRDEPVPRYRTKLIALIVSFSLSVITMSAYDRALTGSAFRTPYGLYTARHTPSHVYGFHNKLHGAENRGPDTLLAYDDWSEDLTMRRAFDLVVARWWGLVQYGAGIVPTASLGLLSLLLLPRMGNRLLLLWLGLAGLTIAYFPFGFAGLLGWGYLVEGLPFLMLVLAVALGRLVADWIDRGRASMGIWWLGLVGIPVGAHLGGAVPDMFDAGSELVYPRVRAEKIRRLEQRAAEAGPVLVLFDAEPKESLHSTLVYNRPTLDGPIVRAWYPGASGLGPRQADPEAPSRLLDAFPDRRVFYCRVVDGAPVEWRLIRPPQEPEQTDDAIAAPRYDETPPTLKTRSDGSEP